VVLEVYRNAYIMNFGGAVAANIAANVTTSNMSAPTFEDVGNSVYQGALIAAPVIVVAGVVDRLRRGSSPSLVTIVAKIS
jgi:hypothetical protein